MSHKYLLKIILFCLSFHNCSDQIKVEDAKFKNRDDIQMIICKSDTIVICWDNIGKINELSSTETYEMYYRRCGDEGWILLKHDIIADLSPCVTIRYSQLGKGVYEFAVRSVTKDGIKSNLHSSIDSTANPAGGWFLKWDLQ